MSKRDTFAVRSARRLAGSLSARAATLSQQTRDWWKTANLDTNLASLRRRADPAAHVLPGPLVVSVTSHPPRFATLHRTLASLLAQDVKPDHVLLWVAESDLALLPAETLRLQAAGLEIRSGVDHGPFTKLIHALREFPDAFIVTGDDDAYYEPGWLGSLVGEHDLERPSVLCRRAHRIRLGDDGTIAPYAEWEWDVQDAAARSPCTDIFPTGVGGVLYPPGSLHPDAARAEVYRTLCPTNDDIWLYWMALRAGSTFRKVGERYAGISWPGSQRCSLARGNVGRRNDDYVRAMVARYGMPDALPSQENPLRGQSRGSGHRDGSC